MPAIDFTEWEGDVTADNIEQVREALAQRMTTRHIVLDKHTLFTKDDLQVGDRVKFTPDDVTLWIRYGGRYYPEWKTITIVSGQEGA